MLLGRKLQMHILPTRSPLLARAPYVVLFHLKSLNEDGNLQVCMYRMHAQKGASEPPRAPFHNLYYGPRFLFLPWAPPILSAALVTGVHMENTQSHAVTRLNNFETTH